MARDENGYPLSETRIEFDIPPQAAADGLRAFAQQSGVGLLFPQALVASVRTNGLHGSYSPREAVAVLLRDTGLEGSISSGDVLVISPAQSPGDNDHRGDSMGKVGKKSLLASIAGFVFGVGVTTGNAQAQQDDAGDGETIEEIVVTGTNLRRGMGMDAASPVTTVTAEEIAIGGIRSTHEALASQPGFTGYVDNDTRAGASGNASVNLRGLGSGFTLVLLNGRRLGDNDLNLMPFSAIERIEVLKDGASAVYGSDALAGVVNVITRKDYDGAELSLSYGGPTGYSSGDWLTASFLGGTSSERGNILWSAQFEDIESIPSLEHPLGITDDLRVYGSDIDLRSPRRNPGLITLQGGTQLMLSPNFAAGETGDSPDDYVAPYDSIIEKRQPNYIQNARKDTTIYTAGTFDLAGEHAIFFGDFMFKESKLTSLDHRGTYLTYEVPAENYWNPFGEDVLVDYLLDYGTSEERFERAPEGMTLDITTTMYQAGIRGDVGPVNYEVAFSDYEKVNYQRHADGLSRVGIIDQLARTDPGALNLFGNAAVLPEQLSPAAASYSRVFTDEVRSLTGLVRFSPFELPAGAVEMAIGAERRDVSESAIRDEALNLFSDAASLTYLNDPSSAISRTIDAYYAEVNIPIFGDDTDRAGLRELDLGVAVREEDISLFGKATVPRYSLRWSPLENDSVVLRASFSESFKAPFLGDLTPEGDRNTDPYADPSILDGNGDPLVYNMQTESGGNPSLDATKGDYLNLGVILRPVAIEGLAVTLDYWDLAQTDAFVYPEEQDVINGAAPGTVIRDDELTPGDSYSGDPVGRILLIVNRVQNAATRDVEGLDLDIQYTFDTRRFGSWSANLANTFVTKFTFDQADGAGPIDNLGKWGWFGNVARYRGYLTVTNQLEALTSRLAFSYNSSVDNIYDDGREIGPYKKVDLTFSYRLSDHFDGQFEGTTVSLNVKNLFDEDTPYAGQLSTRGIASEYAFTNFWIGRSVTAGIKKEF